MLASAAQCSQTSASSNANGIKYVKQSVLVGLIIVLESVQFIEN